MPPLRRCDLAVSQIAFLHEFELNRIALLSPMRNIPGCQDLDLGYELLVDHRVALSVTPTSPSDGPH